MGAWGTGPFENDTAGDWLGDFGPESVALALQAVLDAGESGEAVEAPTADEALAACALVAMTLDESLQDDFSLGESEAERLSDKEAKQHQPQAARCVPLIATSESAELWGDDQEWWSNLHRMAAALECSGEVLKNLPHRPTVSDDVGKPQDWKAWREQGIAALERARATEKAGNREGFGAAVGEFCYCCNQINPSEKAADMTLEDWVQRCTEANAMDMLTGGPAGVSFSMLISELKRMLKPGYSG